MVIEEVIDNSADTVLGGIVVELGQIGLWIQGIGLLVLAWIVFWIITLIMNRKKRKTLYRIEADLKRVEKKLDKVLKEK
jgi:uncharacterized membrane protein YciS (DUF1049 family)